VIGLSTALVLSKHNDLNITVVSKHMPGDYDIEYASPWAGANYWPVGKPGSNLQKFERATWPELDRICRDVPEAGVHFQESRIYGRKKDAGTATGQWFEELCKEDAWVKDVAPNVCYGLSVMQQPSFELFDTLNGIVILVAIMRNHGLIAHRKFCKALQASSLQILHRCT
jgi:glycine/D-amino acid oxidase-like deaminating enzyme